MFVIPTSYTVPAIVSGMVSIDNDENRARLARVEELGSIILSDDPKVSVGEKLDALRVLSSRSTNAAGQSWRVAGAQEAVSKAYWLATASPFAKELDAAGAQFSSDVMSAGRSMQARNADAPNAGQMNLDALSRRSSAEQKMIAYNMGFSSLDAWKADLEQQANKFRDRNPSPAVQMTLSKEAKATFGSTIDVANDVPRSDAERALEIFKDGGATTMGALALMVIEQAADAREAEVATRETGIAAAKTRSTKVYTVGDIMERVV